VDGARLAIRLPKPAEYWAGLRIFGTFFETFRPAERLTICDLLRLGAEGGSELGQ
jgi:hypothetical protein